MPSAKLLSLLKTQNTNIHYPGRIRTRNPSKLVAADPRVRPLGHWDRRIINTLALTRINLILKKYLQILLPITT